MDLLQPHIGELASATIHSAICSMFYRAGVCLEFIRTVPTKYKVFATERNHAETVDHYLNPQRRIVAAMHFFEIIIILKKQKGARI